MAHLLIPYIDYSLCVSCGACAEIYPLFFEMRDGRPWVIHYELFIVEEHRGVVNCCPFRAITLE
jgi:ferredoxin